MADPDTLVSTEPAELPFTGLDNAFALFLNDAQPSSDARHGQLAAMTSRQFGRGHACLDLELLPADLRAAAQTIPWIAGANSPLVLDGPRLYLRRNWQAEQSIQAAIRARLEQSCPEPENLAHSLDKLFPAVPIPVGLNPSGLDPKVPDWQKIACALATRGRLTLITGAPGTGKTTTVVRLLALLQTDAMRKGTPLRIALAAPTGKAAARLGESIANAVKSLPDGMQDNIPAQAVTLHKLLQIRPNQANQSSPELAVDLVIVDEASMIDLDMMARLLAAVPLNASLILLGDKDQLASVEAGAVLGQLCEGAASGNYTGQSIAWIKQLTGADIGAWAAADADDKATGTAEMASALAQQTVMLRHLRRFTGDSGIGQWALAVNAGDTDAVRSHWKNTPVWSVDGNASVDRLTITHFHDRQLFALLRQGWQQNLSELQKARQGVCTDAQALQVLTAFARFQVLCAVREGPWGVVSLNRLSAAALGFQDEGWYAGRPVMVNRNDYKLKLMNGDVGLCLPHANGLRVAFPNGNGGIHWVLPSRLEAVESAFAMTVHKSQGSEFEHVCLVLPDQAVAVLSRELLYTAITRAKTRLSLVVPRTEVLFRAVQMQVLRSGGLMANHLPSAPCPEKSWRPAAKG